MRLDKVKIKHIISYKLTKKVDCFEILSEKMEDFCFFMEENSKFINWNSYSCVSRKVESRNKHHCDSWPECNLMTCKYRDGSQSVSNE